MDKGKLEMGKWPKRIPEWIEKSSIVFGTVLIGGIMVLLLFCGDYSGRLLDNSWLMLFVLAFDLAVGILALTFCRREKEERLKHPILWLVGIYAILYCLQLVWVVHTYFYLGWDVSYMAYAVESVVKGSSMAECSAEIVYSIYPNNLFLFYVLYLIEKVGILISPNSDLYIYCVYASCLSVNLSCFLGHLIVRKLIKSKLIRGLYILVGVAYILASPWSMVPYSDAFGIFFVMLGMWSLLCCDRKYIKWVIVAFAAIIGYHIKPTVIFPLFVTYLVYGIRYLFCLRERWRELAVLVAGTVCFWLIGLGIPLWIQHTFSFHLIPESRITYHHYLMMGVNERSSGGYDNDDYEFSRYQPDVETRKEADMEVFWDRLETLVKERRLGLLIMNKALLNFNSGSMAWEQDGAPFKGGVEHDNLLSDWFDSIVENDGEFLPVYLTVMQVIWLQILCGILLIGIGSRENRAEKACMMLVLCGLMVFVMVFEARARYLYLYSPVFLILSLCGYESGYGKVAEWLSGLRQKRLNEREHED